MAFKDNNSKSRAYFVNSGPTSQFNELSRFTCLTVVQCETLPTLVVGVLWCWFCFVFFWVFVLCCFFLFFSVCSPYQYCRVSLLPMMTWAHRPHGFRTRAKKEFLLVFFNGPDQERLGYVSNIPDVMYQIWSPGDAKIAQLELLQVCLSHGS